MFSDGKTWRLFPASQDHKRAHDGDEGLNTGGMGVVSPLPFVNDNLLARIDREIVTPTLEALAREGTPFVGLLYPGLMLTKDGPKVIEFNVRFGDPETEAYVRLLETDILDIFEASVNGTIETVDIRWKHMAVCNVFVVSAGYPGAYEKGQVITKIEDANTVPGVVVFQAGTKYEGRDLVVSGGRVLCVTALGANLREAIHTAYEAIHKLHFDGMRYRKDIGKKALVAPVWK